MAGPLLWQPGARTGELVRRLTTVRGWGKSMLGEGALRPRRRAARVGWAVGGPGFRLALPDAGRILWQVEAGVQAIQLWHNHELTRLCISHSSAWISGCIRRLFAVRVALA